MPPDGNLDSELSHLKGNLVALLSNYLISIVNRAGKEECIQDGGGEFLGV